MTDELKPLPCPFCGDNSKLIESHRFGPEDTTPRHWKVSCGVVGCNGAAINIWYPSPEDAITAWNRRVKPEELPEWLRNAIVGNIQILKTCTDLDGQAHGRIQALELVLSLKKEASD